MSDDATPRLTPEQSRPLSVAGASVALSAGAGCGKTTVLTERFLAALGGGAAGAPAERRPLRALAAMTFTEKASRELRKRIRGRCHAMLAAAETAADARHWRGVIRGLEAAPVSTFHEYCAGLLRRFALDAGVDPDFQVLDAAIAGAVLDEALTRCVRSWLAASNADLVELAVEFGLRTVRTSLADLVGGRSSAELSAWALCQEDELLAAWRLFWEREGRTAAAAPLSKSARACADWFVAAEFGHEKLKALRGEMLELLPGVGTRHDVDWLAEVLDRAKLPRGLRAQHWPSAEANERAKSVLGGLRKAIERFVARAVPDEETTTRCAAHGLRYARLAAEARRAYDEAKRRRGGLDFDDLLVKTRDLLRADPGLVRRGSARPLEFVLVDEFQDTDPVQSDVLRALGGEAFSGGGLFVVGDFKQSIYRFRGARPQLFQQIRGEFPEAGRHDLTENFRSTAPVIDFVNALFADAFPGETPRLVPGPRSAPAALGPAVEFVWAVEPTPPGEKKARVSVEAGRKTEAQWLARLIRARVEAGWPVRDRKTGVARHATPGDVAFLFRAMTELAPYENALQAEGLDFHVVGGKAFYAQQEVQDLVNVLSVVEDPFDSVALAGALRGPFFGLSDDALLRLGMAGRGELAGPLRRADRVDGLSPSDRDRAARAGALLDRWRGFKDRVPIADLVDRVLDESGFEAALSGEFLGDRKRANARKLVRLARRFDARGGFSLGHFVTRLRADLKEPPREDQAATTEEDGQSVRLMSIHQAKGLEFPIVVVPDLNRREGGQRRDVILHPELGPLVRPGSSEPAGDDVESDADGDGEADAGSGRSLGWDAFDAVESLEEEAESVRLFYVATTRARDHLILSAGVAADANPASAALRVLDARFDRGSGACLAALPDGWAVPSVRVTTDPPPAVVPRVRRKPRPRLGAVARLIEGTRVDPVAPPSATPRPARRPRAVDLDAARRLSPRAARLDRLVRATLADRRVFGPGGLPEAARVAGRAQEPMAHAELVDEAVKLLRPWVEGTTGAEIATAAKVERGAEWSVAWPGGGTVFHGRTEFYTRDAAGGAWRAVVMSAPGAPEAVERLRLLLAARAGEALGCGPVTEGWRVRLGDGIQGEDDFGDDTLAAAVDRALAWVESTRA